MLAQIEARRLEADDVRRARGRARARARVPGALPQRALVGHVRLRDLRFPRAPIPASALLTAAARRWEVVPVVVQDPTWEQSFPLARSVVVPLVEPGAGEVLEVRLSRREARARRGANERRRDELLGGFVALGLDPS